MDANLRSDFKERKHKRFFESITVILLLTKKPCTEIFCPEPFSAVALVLKPSTVAIGTNHVSDGRPSFVGKDARLKLGGPSTSLTQLSDDSVECVASTPPRPQVPRAPKWEEIAKLLK